jgi:hypothetical protein
VSSLAEAAAGVSWPLVLPSSRGSYTVQQYHPKEDSRALRNGVLTLSLFPEDKALKNFCNFSMPLGGAWPMFCVYLQGFFSLHYFSVSYYSALTASLSYCLKECLTYGGCSINDSWCTILWILSFYFATAVGGNRLLYLSMETGQVECACAGSRRTAERCQLGEGGGRSLRT